MKSTVSPLRIGVLGSGSGSNLQSIQDAIGAGTLNARIVCVLSDVPDAGILARAARHGLPSAYLDPSPFRTKLDGEAEGRYIEALERHEAQWVVLAGFMRIVKPGLLRRFEGRVLNIHPALLPAFPGLAAWRQALEHGAKVAGCTVHFVDEGTDTGPILLQRPVPVLEGDTPERLHARIQAEEHLAYPEALRLIASNRLRIEGRTVRIVGGPQGDQAPHAMADPVSPTPLPVQGIVELASAYYGSAVLFAAVELDLFTALAREDAPSDASSLAVSLGLDPRGVRLLLDACVALGLLTKDRDRYATTRAAALSLVEGGAQDLRGAIRYNRDVYPAWGRLTELARAGRPVEAPSLHLGEDPVRTRRFAMAMHGRALGIGRCVVPMLDLSGCKRLLDLAGGPGTYAMLLARAHPGLVCETRDLPAISGVAAELVAGSEVADRVLCRAGDYHTDEYPPEQYDAVTIFGALHQESPERIRSILRRAHAALHPGGRIFILDIMTDPSHARPVFSALFAVNMALTTENGWVFSDAELRDWLAEAGFVEACTRPVPPPMPHWLVSARKALR